MITYRLSTRQLAALESGDGLRLAIPETSWTPVDGSDDEIRQWFLDSVPEIPSVQLGEILFVDVWAHLFNRGGGERSLASSIGEIIDANNVSKMPCYRIAAVVGIIGKGGSAADGRRHFLTRWPGGEAVFSRPDK